MYINLLDASLIKYGYVGTLKEKISEILRCHDENHARTVTLKLHTIADKGVIHSPLRSPLNPLSSNWRTAPPRRWNKMMCPFDRCPDPSFI